MAAARSTHGEGVLSNPALLRLQLSTAATSLGKWAFLLALGVYAFREGGTAAVGLVALVQAVPAVIAAPVLGLAGDRFSRQRVLLATNALRALILAGTAVAVWQGVSTALVFALAALFSTVSTANQPARAALVPFLARSPGEVSSATAVMGSVDTASFLLGAGAGAIVLSATSIAFLMALCCGAYVLAGALMLAIPADARPTRRRRGHPAREIVAGFHTVLADDRLRLVVGMTAVLSTVDGLSSVLVIVTALHLLHSGTAGIGYLNIARGAGGLAGGTVAYALFGRSRLPRAVSLGSVAIGAPMALLAIAPGNVLGLLAWCGLGFGYVLVKVSGIAMVQRLSGDRVLARVLSVMETTLVATIGIGAILAPGLESLLGLRGAILVSGCALPLLALLRWQAIRRLELGAPVPAREFALLRRCALFAPLPLATVEGLAKRLIALEVPAGEVIIRQGDHGDRFYLIESGEVEISQDGRVLRTQGPGDSFGEIALLHDVRRTATVRAIAATHLMVLEREPFLLSVTGHTDSHEEGMEVAGALLQGDAAQSAAA